jgi:hypothetical protein
VQQPHAWQRAMAAGRPAGRPAPHRARAAAAAAAVAAALTGAPRAADFAYWIQLYKVLECWISLEVEGSQGEVGRWEATEEALEVATLAAGQVAISAIFSLQSQEGRHCACGTALALQISANDIDFLAVEYSIPESSSRFLTASIDAGTKFDPTSVGSL